MTVDLDTVLRDHFGPARSAELPPGSWERLEARLSGTAAPAPGGRSPRRWAVLVAAGLLLLVGVVALVTDGGPDDERLGTVDAPPDATDPTHPPTTASTAPSTPPTQPTTPSTDSTPGPTASSLPPAAEPPDSVVVLVDRDGDGLGEVAALDRDGTVRTLVPEAIDEAAPVEGGPSGAISLDAVSGRIAYYERCCEPAVGEVWAVDPVTGEDLGRVTHGEQPTLSPDGRTLAVSVQGVGIQIVGLGSDQGDVVAEVPEAGAPEGRVVTDLAWSPDATTLAVERVRYAEGEVVEVTVDLVQIADGTTDRVGAGIAMPAFLPDGRLVVGTGASVDEGAVRASGLAIVEPETGDRQPRGGPLDLTGVDASADGRWIVVTGSDGAVRVLDGAADLADRGPWAGAPAGTLTAAW